MGDMWVSLLGLVRYQDHLVLLIQEYVCRSVYVNIWRGGDGKIAEIGTLGCFLSAELL